MTTPIKADNAEGTPTALNAILFRTIEQREQTLADYQGQVLLVVNTASKCGLTPQYDGLQELYAEFGELGFTVLGFPSNDFMGQEPGTDDEIAEFCSVTYSVDFPVMSKISVVGEGQHPLYAALTRALPTAVGKEEFRESLRANGITPTEDPDVLWNFEKFLVGPSGDALARFAPSVAPNDPTLRDAIRSALGSSA